MDLWADEQTNGLNGRTNGCWLAGGNAGGRIGGRGVLAVEFAGGRKCGRPDWREGGRVGERMNGLKFRQADWRA